MCAMSVCMTCVLVVLRVIWWCCDDVGGIGCGDGAYVCVVLATLPIVSGYVGGGYNGVGGVYMWPCWYLC